MAEMLNRLFRVRISYSRKRGNTSGLSHFHFRSCMAILKRRANIGSKAGTQGLAHNDANKKKKEEK